MPSTAKEDEYWDDGMTQSLLWDSCDPCAYLCLMIQRGHLIANGAMMVTLDAHGYKTRGGFPDFEKMQREFERCKVDP